MADLLSMGELLIDFTPSGYTEDGRLLFSRNPGGAPANVAVQAARCGVSAGFLGRVGKDMFGDFLLETLRANGIDLAGLSQDPEAATSLAFVQLDEAGDRTFSFYRNPGADTRLRFEDVDPALLAGCKALCFGSLLLTAEPARSAVPRLVAAARAQGKLTAYDPNWRPALWRDPQAGIDAMKSLLPLADVVKASEEEVALLTGEADLEAGARALLDQGVQLVAVTLGAQGSALYHRNASVRRGTYDTPVVDTTGCGDSFFGALLAGLLQSGQAPGALGEGDLAELVDFANAAGAVCATRMGAIPALPDTAAIQRCRQSVPRL